MLLPDDLTTGPETLVNTAGLKVHLFPEAYDTTIS